MLTVSKLWEYDKVAEASDYIDPNVLAKLFTDAWFRHMKSRYLYFEKETEASVLDEFEDLSKLTRSYKCLISSADHLV